MSAHDPDQLPPGGDRALRRLAQHGASAARPGNPLDVRRLGQRRRVRRRQLVGAVTVALVLALGAGTFVATLQNQGLSPAPPVSQDSAVPSPPPEETREVGPDNVVQAADLPRPQADGSWDDDTPAEQASSCQADSWESLGTSSVAANGLRRLIPAAGETEQPLSQAVALQLPDAGAAEQAAAAIREWVDGCPELLESEGEQLVEGRTVTWIDAPTEVGTASFAEVVHAPEGVDLESEGGLWESVGVTVVGDRVAVTVDVIGPTTEYYYSLEPGVADPAGAGPHPQFDLTEAAALRLDDRVPTPPADTEEPPTAQTQPEGATEGAFSETSLPQLEDFEWNEAVTFTDRTVGPESQSTVIPCQQDMLYSLNPSEVWVVTVQGDVSGTAGAMSFPDEAAAEQAWTRLQGWADGCADWMASQGRPVQGEGQQIPVEVAQGEATYHSFALTGDEPGTGQFEDVGMTRVGNRIVVASLVSIGPDLTFDAEPGGPVGEVYPMIRTIQNLNQRLAS